MPITRAARTAATIALMASVVVAAIAQQPTAADDLGVVGVDGVVALGPNQVRFDFGEIDRLNTPTVAHTFLLRNTGSSPLTIDRLQPSCGCETALLQTADGHGGETATLAPRAEASVRVTIDLANQSAAGGIKAVLVYVHGNANPALTLELMYRLRREVVFEPAVVDFGRVRTGTPRSLPVKVTVDSRLWPRGSPLKLSCTVPDIAIQVGSLVASQDGKTVSANCTATIGPHAAIGGLSGTIALIRPSTNVSALPAARQGSAPAVMPERPFPGTAYALTAGEIVGRISASPSLVLFGAVDMAQTAARQITLAGEEASVFEGVKCTTAIPYLSVRLLPGSGTAGAAADLGKRATRVLEVRLGPGRPAGRLDTRIVISLSDGERLVLPVYALTIQQR